MVSNIHVDFVAIMEYLDEYDEEYCELCIT